MLAIIRDINNKEIDRINDPSLDWILEQLNEYTCEIMFRKKLNGRFRTLTCTRNPKKIPVSVSRYGIRNPHGYEQIIPVWDLNDSEWKSFYYYYIQNMNVLTQKKESKNDRRKI